MEQEAKLETATELFELAPEEIEVCLSVKGATTRYQLRHWLRPPALEDWRVYERSLRSTVETAENEPNALRFDSAPLEAAAALYDRLYRRAEGYRLSNPSTSIGTGGNNGLSAEGGIPAGGGIAAEQIPLHHKEMVVRGLSDVAPASPAEEAEAPALFSLDAERVEVTLEAARSGKTYRNLAHVFRAPTAADRVEYSRVTSQALYVRGSHTLKTILPSRLPGLVALYDRLIEQARGYAAAGEPLAERAAVIRQMDPLHKKVAVQMLFGD